MSEPIEVYDVGWSEEGINTFLEMLSVDAAADLLTAVLIFLGARPIHVTGASHSTDGLKVDNTIYNPLVILKDSNYAVVLCEGSHYILIDTSEDNYQYTVLKPRTH